MNNCMNIFQDLVKAIYESNDEITNNVTDLLGEKTIKKNLICVRTNLEQEYYSTFLGCY